MTRDIVGKAKRHESDTVPGDFGKLKTPCPKCGGEIHENYKKFQCQKCDFALWKIVAGRQLEIPEVEELIEKGTVGPLQGFRSKMGKPFAAVIKMGAEFKPEFDFGQGQTNADGSSRTIDLAGLETIGKCPNKACGGRVFENAMSYFCENAVNASPTCAFRTGKIVLQREMEKAQVLKLIETGRTDLLHKFISKKGRPFSAFLVVGEGGKVGFEFAPREPKAKGKPKPKAAGGASTAEPPPVSGAKPELETAKK
jgi:DNA topoisomerase-3